MSAYGGWAVDALVSTPSLVIVLVWLVLAVSLVQLIRVAQAPPRENSRALLDDQFARGELSIEEYRRQRDLIEHG